VNASAVWLRPELAKRSADTDTDLSPVRAMANERQLKDSTVQQMWPVATNPAEFWFLIRDAVVWVQSIAGLAPAVWADGGLDSPWAWRRAMMFVCLVVHIRFSPNGCVFVHFCFFGQSHPPALVCCLQNQGG